MLNKDEFKGKWKEIKGSIKEQWGNLTDDELNQVEGNREKLVGLLQQKYGYDKRKAEEEVDKFEKSHCEECQCREGETEEEHAKHSGERKNRF